MRSIKCRENISINTIKHYILRLAEHSAFGPVLGNILIIVLPALSYSCDAPELSQDETGSITTLRTLDNKGNTIKEGAHADILVFNDDRMRRLDSYQRVNLSECSVINAFSTTGHKIMTVILNIRNDPYGWADINSYEALKDVCIRLEDETEAEPVMSGECSVKAGSPANVTVNRHFGEIVLRSLKCDFSGKSYAGSMIEDVKVYLINVNAEVSLFHDPTPKRIINAGKLVEKDLMAFEEPESICQGISIPVGLKTIRPDMRFRCYPNMEEEDTPAYPHTRLVIEGRVNGKTYYWPFTINRDNGGRGIEGNCRYIYDITIRRLGNNDPDIPINTESATIKTEILTWEEKEESVVRF